MRVEWHEAATAAGRHPPPRLIPSRRSVAPISEDRERPRNHVRGRFSFQRPQRASFDTRAIFRDANGFAHAFFSPTRFQPMHFRSITARTHGHRGPRAGRRCRGVPPRGAQALHRDARCGRRRDAHGHTDCRSVTAGDAKHRSNGLQRYGFASRPVRAALPWRMPEPESGVSTRRHWLNGRAATRVAGCRFDSGMSFLWIAQR